MSAKEKNKKDASITMDKLEKTNSLYETSSGMSMYLSFESDSTVSSAAFKTLDAISDLSNMSTGAENSRNNRTLEADKSGAFVLPTEKKLTALTALSPMTNRQSPLRKFPKNMMQEYKAVCSTPTKEELMRSVDLARGSDAIGCIDLGISLVGVDDEKAVNFALSTIEENKENAHPESGDGSTLSSSFEIFTSVIEQKITTHCITTEDLMLQSNTKENALIVPTIKVVDCSELDKEAEEKLNQVDVVEGIQKENGTLEATSDYMVIVANDEGEGGCKETLGQSNENKNQSNSKRASQTKQTEEKDSSLRQLKMNSKRSLIPKGGMRKPNNEPNLVTNRPTRILPKPVKRASLFNNLNPPVGTGAYDAESNDISKMMQSMLKTKPPKLSTRASGGGAGGGDSVDVGAMKKSLGYKVGRRSLLPPSQSRSKMSTVVKTTLNSPARRTSRRSMMTASSTALKRRSGLKNQAAADVHPPRNELSTRRSMLPFSRAVGSEVSDHATKTRSSTAILYKDGKSTGANRKSVAFGSKEPITSKPLPTKAELAQLFGESAKSSVGPKVETVYTCNICASNFRIKSLLDAHKRSHKSGPGSIMRPRTSTTGVTSISQTGNSTSLPRPATGGGPAFKCNYCDKKFAIARALHIHHMQHCPKIPPADKRKLEYTDLQHEEKAKLPAFTYSQPMAISRMSNATSIMGGIIPPLSLANDPLADLNAGSSAKLHGRSKAFAKPIAPAAILKKSQKILLDIGSSASSSFESLAQKKVAFTEPEDQTMTIKPPLPTTTTSTSTTTSRLKNSSAHAGVYRTPTKAIVCHKCKKTFKSIVEHIDHNIMVHPYSAAYGETEESGEEEPHIDSD